MKQQRLQAHLGAPQEVVVFSILRDLRCSQCQADLPHASFLLIENPEPLCLTCAELDHLVYVPPGDPALSRRARKHSTLSAVVVHFSRRRKRYERQGILVEEAGLEKAQEECLSDAEARACRRSGTRCAGAAKIGRWWRGSRTRFASYSPHVRPARRTRLPSARPFEAAGGSDARPPGGHSTTRR